MSSIIESVVDSDDAELSLVWAGSFSMALEILEADEMRLICVVLS